MALQFPDQLLGDAGVVAARLEEATGSKMFVLGDTAYGRCDVELQDGGLGTQGLWCFPPRAVPAPMALLLFGDA